MNDDDEFGQPDQPALPNLSDAADERAVARKREIAKLAKENEQNFWRRSLADPVGRKAIWNLLQGLGTFENKYGVGPNGFPQPEATWAAYGQRDFGQRFYRTLLLADRDGVGRMHDECDPDFMANQRKPRRNVVNG
jgi:hypothetical protein